jgi:hypothetical protein
VRAICAAWERGDFSSADWAHPQIEYVVADGAEPGSWTGLAGIAEAWRSRLSAWEDVRLELEEYRELDEERVLVFYQPMAKGKASGLDVAQLRATGAIVFYVRGEKVMKFVQYNDAERALNDLELPLEMIPSR